MLKYLCIYGEKGDVAISKRKKRLLLIIPGVVLLALIILCITQWNNLRSIYYSMEYSEEELADIQKEKEQKLADDLGVDLQTIETQAEKFSEVLSPEELLQEFNISVPSEQTTSAEGSEQAQISSGSVTKQSESAVASKHKDKSSNTTGQKGTSNSVSADTVTVDSLLTDFYVLKNRFIGALESLSGSAQNEFYALPSAERNGTNRAAVIAKYLGIAAQLEVNCDSEVSVLLSQMTEVLKQNGQDATKVSEINSYYYTQKAIYKAKYINKYKTYLSYVQ